MNMPAIRERCVRGILAVALAIAGSACGFESVRELPVARQAELIAFEEAPVVGGGDNEWNERKHPFVGAAAIDVDGDGVSEIFAGGGDGHDDMLFAWRDGALRDVAASAGISEKEATHGANSLDMDGDGDVDLILARNDGIYLYLNDGRGVFSKRRIPVSLPADSTPFNVAAGDIDGDGDADLYVSAFVDLANFRAGTFNDPSHAKTNVMLLNNGDLSFSDITSQSGTASMQNTFLSSFIDLDGDGRLDLVAAQNTGQVEIFRNLGGARFASVNSGSGWGFWMGLAAGDVDGDGDEDLFFTNSGSSVPEWMLEALGDATDEQPRNYDWLLLQNDGGFQFSDVTEEYQLDGFGFGWGAAFEDLTLDGQLELLAAQNYIKWLPHRLSKLPGKAFVRDGDVFYDAPELGLQNPAFAQSPIIADIDGDGRPDVFWLNMEGRGRAFLNRSAGNFLTFAFPDAPSSIGARAFVETPSGVSITRVVHNNIGMSTDQWSALVFGLGSETRVLRAVVEWPDGSRSEIANPPVNRVIPAPR